MGEKYVAVPSGWPCKLSEARPGHFCWDSDYKNWGFKSEYTHDDGRVMAFNEGGEFFSGGDDFVVQPVEILREEDD